MGAAAIQWKRAGEAGLDEDDRGLLADSSSRCPLRSSFSDAGVGTQP